jgi:hypothetical protein
MKKLFFVLGIVSLLLSCNNGASGGNMENTSTKEQEQEQEQEPVYTMDPNPVTNMRHTKNGDVYTVYFDHDGVNVKWEFHATVGCSNGVSARQKNYDYLDKNAREYTFNLAELNKKFPCPHTPECKAIYVSIGYLPPIPAKDLNLLDYETTYKIALD